jgi:hypothetical protein
LRQCPVFLERQLSGFQFFFHPPLYTIPEALFQGTGRTSTSEPFSNLKTLETSTLG